MADFTPVLTGAINTGQFNSPDTGSFKSFQGYGSQDNYSPVDTSGTRYENSVSQSNNNSANSAYADALRFNGLQAEQNLNTNRRAMIDASVSATDAYKGKLAAQQDIATSSSSTYTPDNPDISGGRASQQALQNAQNMAAVQRQSADNDRYNQSLLMQQNLGGQTNLAGDQQKSNEKIAGIDASSRVFSSLLGSVAGGGTQNYRYW